MTREPRDEAPRRTRMNRRCLLLLIGLFVVVLTPVAPGPASASCAGASLEVVDGVVLVRGEVATVEGSHFVDGCRDTMTCSGVGGCQSCRYDEPPEAPMQDVALELRQDGRSWRLGTADAGTAEEQRLGHATWTVELPEGVRPGRARLLADTAQPVDVRIR